MIRIAIEVQADDARAAQDELETVLRNHGFVPDDAEPRQLYDELRRALMAEEIDYLSIVQRYRHALWADRLSREAA
jgi:hypothetical protein